MKRIIRLTENDLTRIVKRVIKEQSTPTPKIEKYDKLEEYDKEYLLGLMTDANNILSDIFKRTYDEDYDDADKVKYLITKMFNEFIQKITNINYVMKLTPLNFREIEDRLGKFSRSQRLTTLSREDINIILKFISFLEQISKAPTNEIFVSEFKNSFKRNLKEFLNKIKNVRVQSNMKSLPTKPSQQIPTNRKTPEPILKKSPFEMSGIYGSK